jgi:hypothetical protein
MKRNQMEEEDIYAQPKVVLLLKSGRKYDSGIITL